MRKVSSKPSIGFQQPATQQLTGLSPMTNKQQSMIHLYKVKAQNSNSCQRALPGKQPAAFISKTIQGRRQNMIVQKGKQEQTNKEPLVDSNQSAQMVKPSRLFSPGDALVRKNDTIIGTTQQVKDRSPDSNILFQITERTHQKKLSKDKSLKSFFGGTQRLTKNQSTKNLSTANQRLAIRRGSKMNGNGAADNKQNSTMAQIFNNTHSMTRNKSQYLTFKKTQKVQNYTSLVHHQNKKEISPCIYSDEEENTPHKPQLLKKKGLQQPNGSFIEKKMHNCLQSRNTTQELVYTAQSDKHPASTHRQLLMKNTSQPILYSEAITQRNNLIKPTNQNKQLSQEKSNKSGRKEMKNDMKSLTLSPIIPLNATSTQRCDNGGYEALATTQKRLNLDSIKKHYQSQKDAEPTTEKKRNDNWSIKNIKSRPGHCSQETEKAAGATHSYSTADDYPISVIELRKRRDINEECSLRKANNEGLKPNKQQETAIKVTQILNNNKMNNRERYNIAVTPDYIPAHILNQQQLQMQNKTPKAIPFFQKDNQKVYHVATAQASENAQTQRNKRDHVEASFKADVDSADEYSQKDFDEFLPGETVQHQDQRQDLQLCTFGEQSLTLKTQNHKANKGGNSDAPNVVYNTVKEDRDSLVNYDNSLLTYNTFRENHQSPVDMIKLEGATRNHQPQKEACKPQLQDKIFLTQSGSSFVIPNTEDGEENITKEYEMTKTEDELLSDEENGLPNLHKTKRQALTEMDSKYKDFFIQIQKEEETAILKLTKRIKESCKYKGLLNDKAKMQYLQCNIEKVRQQFRQLFFDKVYNQALQQQ